MAPDATSMVSNARMLKRSTHHPVRKREANGFADESAKLASEDDQKRRPRAAYICALPHSPTSEEDHRAAELVRCIQDYGASTFSIAFIPSRLGHSDVLDTAAELMIQLHRHTLPQFDFEQRTPVQVIRSFTKAISLLRRTLDLPLRRYRDATVAASSIVGVVDCLLRHQDSQWESKAFTHWCASDNIVLSTPGRTEQTLSELERSVMYAGGARTFRRNVLAGTASAFESPMFLDIEPPIVSGALPMELDRLRKISYRLFVRLPRLIALVRQAVSITNCEDDLLGECAAARKAAAQTAEDLLSLEDEDAESWLLHRVHVVPTTDPGDSLIIQWSYEFESPTELEAAVSYWGTRVLLQNLRVVLHDLETISPRRDSVQGTHSRAWLLAKEEMSRMCTNVLMSWQYASSLGICGTCPMTSAFLIIWSALRQHGTQLYRGAVPISVVGAWLHKRTQQSFAGWGMGPSMESTDAASFILAGGPLVPFPGFAPEGATA